MSSVTPSLYRQCKQSEIGSPRKNLHVLHQKLLNKHRHLLDDNFESRFKGNEFHSRRSELYIVELLSNSGNGSLKISKSPNGHGPDLTFGLSTIVGRIIRRVVDVLDNGMSFTFADCDDVETVVYLFSIKCISFRLN